MKRAGAETMIMQYLRQLVKDDRFEFSILVHGYDKGDYDDEIATFGVPIYHVPVRGKHPLTYTHEVKKVLKTHPVDIIHCNGMWDTAQNSTFAYNKVSSSKRNKEADWRVL